MLFVTSMAIDQIFSQCPPLFVIVLLSINTGVHVYKCNQSVQLLFIVVLDIDTFDE
ncbi:hypothetical protein HOF65_02660 [bacterium]|nr:hypothetical protein [bacterium]MBT3852902.1 hypothetical protein [bacterium]MBT4633784.1 hypothetical protein [bacterium]MBT6779504.1 hypothetical protein [bacterium]